MEMIEELLADFELAHKLPQGVGLVQPVSGYLLGYITNGSQSLADPPAIQDTSFKFPPKLKSPEWQVPPTYHAPRHPSQNHHCAQVRPVSWNCETLGSTPRLRTYRPI